MLRIHFLQQWFNLSDPAMEETLYDTPTYRDFVGPDAGEDKLPDQWHLGMRAHIGVDTDSGLVHTVEAQRRTSTM